VYRGTSRGGQGGETLAASLLLIAVVVLVLLIWLGFKALNLLIRVVKKYPTNRWLWGSLLVCLLSWLGACLLAVSHIGTQESLYAVGIAWALLATGFLLCVARVVELAGDQLLQIPPDTFVNTVLRTPWWNMD
jgi:hypothetical protein